MSNYIDETQFNSLVRPVLESASRRNSNILPTAARTPPKTPPRSPIQKSPSQTGQSLLSARLTDSNGFLLVNEKGITSSADSSTAVNRIAADLLRLESTRRPSAQSIRNQFSASQTNLSIKTSSNFLSNVETSILRSENPIEINETEEIEVNGERGIWANKNEVINWRGEIPITQYLINQDTSPEMINKKSAQQLEYIQELAIRYLRPPTPPAPGEIIINQMPNFLTAPAPPLVIRQQPPRPQTPEPLVLREAPPQPPVQVGRKIITISGKRIPPPPRKVIIERLAPLPAKPQPVIVERWLPYAEVKRRVIFQKPSEADPIVIKPKNVIIQWEAPQVSVKKEYKYLGVVRANPADYVELYGEILKKSHELPQFVLDIQTPNGLVLAAEKKNEPTVHELEGDVEALNLINLESEGLGQYRSQLEKLGLNGRKNSGNLSRSVSAAYLGLSSASSRKSSLSTSNQFLASSIPNNNSTVFQSASFVTQKPASLISEKTASIVSEKPLPERPPSVKSPILKSPTYSGVFPGSRAVSIQVEPEPVIVPETPKYSTRSILKSSSTVLPQQTYSTSSKIKTTQSTTFSNQPTLTGTSLNKLPSFSSSDSISGIIEKIFRSIDKTNKGTITVEDAEKILLRLNSRLGRRYGEDDVKALFATLDINNDGQLDLEEFKRAFLNLTN